MTGSGAQSLLPLNTFILKVANRCNIDCDYCYVFHSPDQSWQGLPKAMSLEVADRAAKRIAEHAHAHRLTDVQMTLHGGEPLLAGPVHIAALLKLLRDRIGGLARVHFSLQTNATLVTSRWLDVFEEHRVLVGVSLDGPPAANDRHRLTLRSESTSESVERGIELLRSRPGVFGAILAVVDVRNDPAAVHDYLAGFAPPMIDFNLPHANHDTPPPLARPGFPVYGQWMAEVYDRWLQRPELTHGIRFFDDVIALSLGARGSTETLGLAPSGIVVIESDGGIESVDTLRTTAPGATALGFDVIHHSFDEVLEHPALERQRAGFGALAETCRLCTLVRVCGGGYLPHRYSEATGFANPSVYCDDLQHVIHHVQQSLKEVGCSEPASL